VGPGKRLHKAILIVDDHFAIRRSLRQLFESTSGWEVCGEAINGREAIEKAQQLHPDLIVLDLSMPEMDGLQTARVLKKRMPEVPIILFTNFGQDPFMRREALEAGINMVVSKSDGALLVKTARAALRQA
jgi:DNA-binding NarL/FixJ family response regulator